MHFPASLLVAAASILTTSTAVPVDQARSLGSLETSIANGIHEVETKGEEILDKLPFKIRDRSLEDDLKNGVTEGESAIESIIHDITDLEIRTDAHTSKRGIIGGLSSIIITLNAAATLFQDFGGKKLACQEQFLASALGLEDNFSYTIGKDDRDNYFLVCWMNDTDVTTWTEDDSTVANCLTNLHYTQEDACISVEDSSCDLDDYLSNGGQIQNVQEQGSKYLGAISSSDRISAEESSAFQAGWSTLSGLQVRTSNGMGPFVYQVTDSTATENAGSTFLEARFQDGDSC